MARLHDLFTDITDRIRATARVETVYGEPQTLHGRTVILVARVAYGFGAGGGESQSEGGYGPSFGGGGGGGVSVRPVGALIITDTDERFVPFRDWWGMVGPAVGAFFMGYVIGWFAGRRVSAPPPSQR